MTHPLPASDLHAMHAVSVMMFQTFKLLGDEEGMRQASAQENEMRRLIYGPCDVDDELAQLKLESQS